MIFEYPKIIAQFVSLLDIWACICMWSRLSVTSDSTCGIFVKVESKNQTKVSKIFHYQDIHQFWDNREGIWCRKVKLLIFCNITKNIVIKIIIQQIHRIPKSFNCNNDTKTEKNWMRTTPAPPMGQIWQHIDKRTKLSRFKN